MYTRSQVRRDVLPTLINQISSLYEYYSNQNLFWLCRSSLLVVYDGLVKGHAVVKMIDFAHNVSQDIPGDDTGVEVGLKNLVEIFGFIEKGETEKWTFVESWK